MSEAVAHAAAQPIGTRRAIAAAASDIKLSHSVFALPFALLAAALAIEPGASLGRIAGLVALVLVCMVLARTWAMLVNRIADWQFDAANPRTANRAIPAGRLTRSSAIRVALGCAALFGVVCSGFWLAFGNPWPVLLAAPVLGWIALYSYTKRFTWLCHLFLGGALAASPLAAAIAVEPAVLASSATIWLLAGMVALWVAGFDVIYALQDVAFDRSAGLSSVPASLGVGRALWISRALHAGAFALLVAAWQTEPRLGLLFGLAVAGVGLLLIAEHVVLAKRGEKGLDMAFFTLNGVISCILGAAGIADLLL